MKQHFQGWDQVVERLREEARRQGQLAQEKSRLNVGQQASLRGIASRIAQNGVVIADEVGMGKTRIAVELARCVIESGGRVAILVPPGLGFQWQAELRDGGLLDVPPILRSLHAFLAAWDADDAQSQQPWFEKRAVMVSHAFANWRLGERADPWRFALLPELYARWRKKTEDRLPRGYHDNENLTYRWPSNAAESIAAAVPRDRHHPVRCLLDQLLDVEWPRPLDATEYGKYGDMRVWLERSIGFGLGVFDPIIIDEAHKSRGTNAGLSRLLGNVVVPSRAARRLALTATPVELDVSQWYDTLRRLGLDDTALRPVQDTIGAYADAVKRVRETWRSNGEGRAAYKAAATQFQIALSPYLLRRDKREDPEVQCFHNYSQLPINAYRREKEITVEPSDLSVPWRRAICAAESLSVVTRQSDDSRAKRLRLTLGNGHGIATLLNQMKRDDADDVKQEEHDEPRLDSGYDVEETDANDVKRQKRVEWWLNTLNQAFLDGDDTLFDHPAIVKAVEVIEAETARGEKVLVFGRFTRPLRALVDVLNAREMLRRVRDNRPWPQTKVHDGDNSEWPSVRAAHRQLNSPLSLEKLDETLRAAYERENRRRAQFRERLVFRIEQGMHTFNKPDAAINAIFDAFKRSVESNKGERSEQGALAFVARAMMELLGNLDTELSASDHARAFCDLIMAVSDRDDADQDNEIDDIRAAELWETIEERLVKEYDRPQGGFARLMFGDTAPESRRMIQLAFNRPNSFPRVLVAQSLVGREGLNLHKACRIVVLLHPEWNPGVVEQQIGRVDRVDSHWCNELKKAIAGNTPADQLPRIEVRPVIFRGTYDEHNWAVLRTRWNDLRAQLHGIVIPPSELPATSEEKALIDEISKAAPKFSPTDSKDRSP